MNSKPLRIAHITDTHIVAEPGGEVCGIDSFVALESILAMIERDPWRPDLLIVTGDLSEDGSAASYQRVRSLLATVGLPVYCLPGNHDLREEMGAHLEGDPIRMTRSVDYDPWRIVLLDSQVPGEGKGYLDWSELDALENALREAPDHLTMVGLHHGPLPVCPIPGCRLENAGEFLDLLRGYPNVRGIISGHVHCAVDEHRDGIQMLVTPSTCVHGEHPDSSHVPDGRSFLEVHRLDTGRRGFRRLELYPDGRIVTEVIWDDTAGSSLL